MQARSLVAFAALATSLLHAAPSRASDPSLPPGYGAPRPYYPYPAYGYPPYGQPPPPPAPAMERRSPGIMGAGIALTAVGGIALMASGVVAISSIHCSSTYGSCGSSHMGAQIGLTIGGLIGLGVGIPLIVYGAKKVPVVSGQPVAWSPWIGQPGGAGWQWRF